MREISYSLRNGFRVFYILGGRNMESKENALMRKLGVFLVLICALLLSIPVNAAQTVFFGRYVQEQVPHESQEEQFLENEEIVGNDTYIDGIRYYIRDGYYYKDAPIEWYIIKDNGNSYTLLSKYVLGTSDYDGRVTGSNFWDTSGIRKFLNTTFIERAFSPNEQNQLIPVVNTTKEYTYESIYIVGDRVPTIVTTEDRVFLLSKNEITEGEYEIDRSMLIGIPVKPINTEQEPMSWFLRGPCSWSYGNQQVPHVKASGETGSYYGTYTRGIRPCICVPKTAPGLSTSRPETMIPSGMSEPVVATDLKAAFEKYNQILLTWKPARKVKAYKVFYRLSPDDDWTLINETNNTSFRYKHAYSGNEVSFLIVNVNADGTNGGFSDPITVSYPIVQKNPRITVKNEKEGKIEVSWSKDPIAKGYEISVATKKDTKKATKKTGAGTKKWKTALKNPQKKNYIRVRSYFLEGTKKIYTPWSAPSLCQMQKTGSGSTSVKPKVWSLVIGGFESEELGRTKKEVDAVSNRLSKNRLKNYTVKKPVKRVYEDNFTIPQFYALVQQTFYQTGKNDISYVYYHGHGNEDGLCMYNPYINAYETFMYKDILDMLSQHIRGTIIFIIDACHSGECVRVVKTHPSRSRFVIIAAAKKDQSARNAIGFINLIMAGTRDVLHLPSSLMKIDDRSRLSLALESVLKRKNTIKQLCNRINTACKSFVLENSLAKQSPVFYRGPADDMVIYQ